MTFHHFDSSVHTNEFWTLPIARINQNLERNHQKDTLQRGGIALVYGCPLPAQVMERIEALKAAFQRTILMNGSNARIEWRQNTGSLHFSIFGLIVPDEYGPGESWPLKSEQMEHIQKAFEEFGGFTLQLHGIGILGMGAVSVRVSDSPELERLRDAVAAIPGVSQERFGSRTKKIVLGRIAGPLGAEDRDAIKHACDACLALEVGSIVVDTCAIIHYKNTHLDGEFERVSIKRRAR